MKDVRRFAEEFQANESRLDILVNNAGASDWDRTVAFTDERLEKKMATNYFGPFLLTQQLLGSPCFKAALHTVTLSHVD